MKIDDHDRDKIVKRYTERFRQFGHDLRTINPGTEERHRLQHEVHASIGDLDGRTVLDIGCGLAHYYEFLKRRDMRVTYVGYDIVPDFIASNQERFPEATFEVRDVSTAGIGHEADYVTMCQVFNNRYEHVTNEEVVRRAISVAFEAARIGVSIDMLSSHVNYREEHLNYFSPEEMFTFAKSLTRFVALRHDYLPYHFTLFLYKEASA